MSIALIFFSVAGVVALAGLGVLVGKGVVGATRLRGIGRLVAFANLACAALGVVVLVVLAQGGGPRAMAWIILVMGQGALGFFTYAAFHQQSSPASDPQPE
jgi:hypothetical protein